MKDKNSGVKLMGFGHRVYKNYDPRAKLMRETCHEVLNELGLHDDPLFKLAMALEKIALEDEYFVTRKLYPNVDFYSGIVQRALGIPVTLFTAHLRAGAHGGLDRAMERDDLRPGAEDRPSAPAVYRRAAERCRADRVEEKGFPRWEGGLYFWGGCFATNKPRPLPVVGQRGCPRYRTPLARVSASAVACACRGTHAWWSRRRDSTSVLPAQPSRHVSRLSGRRRSRRVREKHRLQSIGCV